MTVRYLRRFEELTDICDAVDLDVQLHAHLYKGKAGQESAEYDFIVLVTDGADGRTVVTARGLEGLDQAAQTALNELRSKGIGA